MVAITSFYIISSQMSYIITSAGIPGWIHWQVWWKHWYNQIWCGAKFVTSKTFDTSMTGEFMIWLKYVTGRDHW